MKNERGAALITSIVVGVIALSIAGSLTIEVQSRHKIQTMQTDIAAAESIALSGVEKIRRFLYVYKYDGTWAWSDILQYNRNFTTDTSQISQMCTSHMNSMKSYTGYPYYNAYYHTDYQSYGMDTLPEAPVPSNPTDPMGYPVVFGVPSTYGTGDYFAVIQNDNADPDPLIDTNEKVDLVMTGVMPNGTTKQIRVRLRYDREDFKPLAALTTGGNLRINGSPEVTGSYGSVHTNMSALLDGRPEISQKMTAVGSVSVIGTPIVDGGIWPFSSTVPLPDVNPSEFIGSANYLLKADGTVVDNATGLPIASLAPSGTWNGFKYSAGDWSANGNDVLTAATYYIETFFTLNGNASANATFLVANSVKVAGTAAVSGTGTMTILAQGDMELLGTATFQGFLATQEQIKVSGSPKVIGSVLARDKQDLFTQVSTTSTIYPDVLMGSAGIHYDAPFTTMLKVGTRVAPESMWRVK